MSHTWDPDRYLTYADERGRPFIELLSRIAATAPTEVVDLGCGAGNLTGLLAERWPDAHVVGLDSSSEMIAAAHASCFSMMLAKLLSDQNKTPTQISTTATLTMRVDTSGPKITQIHIVTEASVPGIDEAGFRKAAEDAKNKCPISVLLKPGLESLTFDAKLSA